jgi:hypothetical protein
MILHRSRTFFSLRLGSQQCVTVVVHVRQRSDLQWFNQHHVEHWNDLLHLLRTSILPRMCSDEIEEYSTKQERPPPLGPGGIPIASALPALNERRTRRSSKKRKISEVVAQPKQAEEDSKDRVNTDPVFRAIGRTLQVAYRLVPLETTSSSATLVHCKQHALDQDHEASSHWVPLRTLSQRILVFCSPLDEDDTTAALGFCRPELIPMAELFKSPPEEATTTTTTGD